MGQQTTPSNVTTTSKPPEYLQPYLQDIAGRAQGLYQPGLTPEQQQAISQARAPSSLAQAGLGTLQGTARGDFLFGGPGFNAAYQAAANKIIPQVNSQFALAGRSGSGLAQTAQTQALADAFASQYGQERGLQQQAAMAAPGAAQQQAQYGINLANLPQDLLYGNLSNYSNIINPQLGAGGTSTQSSQLYRNPASGFLGGGLAGLGVASSLGSSLPEVWGGLGGLVGLLSDRKAKKNIIKIGKYKNGLNKYRFNYKHNGMEMIGVMADEVESIFPHAIIERDGFKYVDYSVLELV